MRAVFMKSALFHWEHQDYLANLLKHTSGYYSFERYMVETSVMYLWAFVLKRTPNPGKKLEHYLWAYCYGGIRYGKEWLLGNVEAAPGEMADVCEATMPEPLKRILFAE